MSYSAKVVSNIRQLYQLGMIPKEISLKTGVSAATIYRKIQDLIPDELRVRGDDCVGHVKKDGYIQVYYKGRLDLRHRVVAAKILGRDLTDTEVVHHCNGDRQDNRPENLWVFPDQSAHRKYHQARPEIHPDTIKLEDCL